MGFPRQEYWSGLLFPPPGDFPDPGIEPSSRSSPALAGTFFTAVLVAERVGWGGVGGEGGHDQLISTEIGEGSPCRSPGQCCLEQATFHDHRTF